MDIDTLKALIRGPPGSEVFFFGPNLDPKQVNPKLTMRPNGRSFAGTLALQSFLPAPVAPKLYPKPQTS